MNQEEREAEHQWVLKMLKLEEELVPRRRGIEGLMGDRWERRGL